MDIIKIKRSRLYKKISALTSEEKIQIEKIIEVTLKNGNLEETKNYLKKRKMNFKLNGKTYLNKIILVIKTNLLPLNKKVLLGVLLAGYRNMVWFDTEPKVKDSP